MDQIGNAQSAPNPHLTHPLPAKAARVALVDAARGIALVAMIVFHFFWDLEFFSLAETNVTGSPFWVAFAHTTAGSFLVTVGVSLVLAHGAGLRSKSFWRRLGLVAAAAGLVTLGSWFTSPDALIWFGILHCIAVSSVLGLAFLRLRLRFVIVAAVMCLTAPAIWTSPVFNAPGWLWLGLASDPPPADDYIPLLPWFGLVLAGIAAARLALAARPQETWARWQPRHPVSRLLAFGGRHSLIVYLVHQPLLLGALWAMASLFAAGR